MSTAVERATADAVNAIERVREVANGVLNSGHTSSSLRTHWDGCHQLHAACLAALVLNLTDTKADQRRAADELSRLGQELQGGDTHNPLVRGGQQAGGEAT